MKTFVIISNNERLLVKWYWNRNTDDWQTKIKEIEVDRVRVIKTLDELFDAGLANKNRDLLPPNHKLTVVSGVSQNQKVLDFEVA